MSEAHPAPRASDPDQEALVSGDDGLSDVDKLCKYILSPIPLQRLVYVKRLTDTARDAGFAVARDRLVPLLEVIPRDSEHVIRQALASELQGFSEFLLQQAAIQQAQPLSDDSKLSLETTESYNLFLNNAIPCLHRLLADSIQEVRDVASQSIVALAPRIHGSHIEESLLRPVIALIRPDHNPMMDDEQKGSAIAVLNELSAVIGRVLAQELISQEIISLSQDQSFRVRKACAQNYGNVSKAVGMDFAISKLLPSFVKLANDTIWSVRKGCVESLVDVAAAVDKDVRQSVLIPMLTRFTSDVSRWVRNAAYRCLGPFIYECEAELITPGFLELFTGIPKLSNSLVDAEVNFFCAYNFPAVVLRLGPQRWGELMPTYQTLCKDTKFKVRKTLSWSLHEIATILGTKLTENYLLPTFDLFLKDLDEVRIGVITSVCKFLQVLTPESRIRHIDTLRDIQREPDQNWRFRELLAAQLGDLPQLFPVNILALEIVPIMVGLVRDRIASVRQIAVQKVGQFINALETDVLFIDLLQELHSLGISSTYKDRQLFIKICEGIAPVVSEQRFCSDFLPLFASLAKDRVPNVRILLSQVLGKVVPQISYLKNNLRVKTALFLLKDDIVRDVKSPLVSLADLDQVTKEITLEQVDWNLDFTLTYGHFLAPASAPATPSPVDVEMKLGDGSPK